MSYAMTRPLISLGSGQLEAIERALIAELLHSESGRRVGQRWPNKSSTRPQVFSSRVDDDISLTSLHLTASSFVYIGLVAWSHLILADPLNTQFATFFEEFKKAVHYHPTHLPQFTTRPFIWRARLEETLLYKTRIRYFFFFLVYRARLLLVL
jgi:hypothetical protein